MDVTSRQSGPHSVVSNRLSREAELASQQVQRGVPLREMEGDFNASLRLALTDWVEQALALHPAPRPVCVVQLGSGARSEAMPGAVVSSDVDYAIVAEEGCSLREL